MERQRSDGAVLVVFGFGANVDVACGVSPPPRTNTRPAAGLLVWQGLFCYCVVFVCVLNAYRTCAHTSPQKDTPEQQHNSAAAAAQLIRRSINGSHGTVVTCAGPRRVRARFRSFNGLSGYSGAEHVRYSPPSHTSPSSHRLFMAAAVPFLRACTCMHALVS